MKASRLKKQQMRKKQFQRQCDRVRENARIRKEKPSEKTWRFTGERKLPEEVDSKNQYVYLFLLGLQASYDGESVMLYRTPNDHVIRFDILSHQIEYERSPTKGVLDAIRDLFPLRNKSKHFPYISVTCEIGTDKISAQGVIHIRHDPSWLQWAFLGCESRTVGSFLCALEHPRNPTLIDDPFKGSLTRATMEEMKKYLLASGLRVQSSRFPTVGTPPLSLAHAELKQVAANRRRLTGPLGVRKK